MNEKSSGLDVRNIDPDQSLPTICLVWRTYCLPVSKYLGELQYFSLLYNGDKVFV
jgi:hypothetical protein